MDWQTFIKQLRSEPDGTEKMSLSEIADAVGTPLSTISSIATGATKQPRADLAIRLLEKFGTTPDSKAA